MKLIKAKDLEKAVARATSNEKHIFAVKLLFKFGSWKKHGSLPANLREAVLFEEQVIFVKAKDFDDALIKSEKYALKKQRIVYKTLDNAKISCSFTGAFNAYKTDFDPKLKGLNLKEAYSRTEVFEKEPNIVKICDFLFGKSRNPKKEKYLRSKFSLITERLE